MTWTAIKGLILGAVKAAAAGTAFVPTRDEVMRFSRAGTTERLASLLDEIIGSSAGKVRRGTINT